MLTERRPGTEPWRVHESDPSLSDTLAVRVHRRREVATDVVELELRAPDGSDLAPWSPGAHVDVHLGGGLVRQYSLCGDPEERAAWTIAVLREKIGRGGSRRLCDEIREEDVLTVSIPRNHFSLQPSQHYLFIAGGIGITPFLPMIDQSQKSGSNWHLCYGGRAESSMAYAGQLTDRYGDRVGLVPEDRYGLIDLDAELTGLPAGARVYCCGPEGLIRDVQDRCATREDLALHLERFAPMSLTEQSEQKAFEVELCSTGTVRMVPADRSLLEVLLDEGIEVLSSCEEGTCGSCETPVVSGTVDHRDSVLTAEERAANDTMMVCVSRASSPRLVLDL